MYVYRDLKTNLLLQMAELCGAFVGSPVYRQSLKFFWLEECIDGGTYSPKNFAREATFFYSWTSSRQRAIQSVRRLSTPLECPSVPFNILQEPQRTTC